MSNFVFKKNSHVKGNGYTWSNEGAKKKTMDDLSTVFCQRDLDQPHTFLCKTPNGVRVSISKKKKKRKEKGVRALDSEWSALMPLRFLVIPHVVRAETFTTPGCPCQKKFDLFPWKRTAKISKVNRLKFHLIPQLELFILSQFYVPATSIDASQKGK